MKPVTAEQLDKALREINEIFARFDTRLSELEEKQNKPTRATKAKEISKDAEGA